MEDTLLEEAKNIKFKDLFPYSKEAWLELGVDHNISEYKNYVINCNSKFYGTLYYITNKLPLGYWWSFKVKVLRTWFKLIGRISLYYKYHFTDCRTF